MPLPTAPTEHIPGEPVNGWHTGFDWDNPLNAKEKGRLSAELDFMTKISQVSRELVSAVDKLDTVLGNVEANGYDWRANLPPFPLPGTLAPVSLNDVGLAMPVALLLMGLLSTETPLDVYVEGVLVQVPAKPLHVLRRLAKGGN